MWDPYGLALVAVIGMVAAVAAAWYALGPSRAARIKRHQDLFVEERAHLNNRRAELTAEALAFHTDLLSPDLPGMLGRPEWSPARPTQARQLFIQLDPSPEKAEQPAILTRVASTTVLPPTVTSSRYDRYSTALSDLARPTLFQDLICYRLLDVDLASSSPTLSCGVTSFFRSVDSSEALAHEFAREGQRRDLLGGDLPIAAKRLNLRRHLTDPDDLTQRTTIFSISALTIRDDGERSTFFLHRRNSTNVAIAGNLLHLAPSGIFQPTADDPRTITRDLDIWLTLCREYAEEFLGVEEAQGAAGIALSYTHDTPYRELNAAYEQGRIRIYVCGLGMDPLTLCPELITMALIDAEVFDEIFADLRPENTEGTLQGSALRGGRVVGYPFDPFTLQGLLQQATLSPAAHAALSNAWTWHRQIASRGNRHRPR